MSINKNQVTANEIDILFQKTWCDECVDGGYCVGCLVYEALEAANKLTKRAPNAGDSGETPNIPNAGAVIKSEGYAVHAQHN